MLGTFEEELGKIEAEYRQYPQDDLLAALSGPSARAVIFGAGVVGKHLASTMNESANGKLAAFCDNFKTGSCEEFHIPIVSPDELTAHYRDAVIIVAVGTREINDEIYNQVLELGFHCEQVFRCYSGFGIVDLNQYRDGYKWAYEFFEDAISKTIILNRIRGYFSYFSYFEMEHSPLINQYFDQDVIQFSNQEVFIDGGCYTGDTVLEFIRRMKGKYDFIYGFEPERDIFETAKLNLNFYENIELINKGLWSKADQLYFHAANTSSTVTANGETSISVTSLDEFFCDGRKRLPTFIKLDIEGSEKEALFGMKNVIAKAHPKLAVCVYHKPEDIYELPQLIMNLGPGYKFTLRHYGEGMYETVLYAL